MTSLVSNNLIQDIDFGFFALVDPDNKNDSKLDQIIFTINNSNFSCVLVGGSSISDSKFNHRLKKIKNGVNKPVILFPGSSNQISQYADGILFTSLLSGRNPKYLIDEQVRGVELIKKYNLSVIPTGYLLIGPENNKISVQRISGTMPLDFNNKENILHHALAAEYFGMKYIYLENGSGSDSSIKPGLVNYLCKNINIPIIVGGGIKTRKEIQDIKEAGARFIVIGNLLEENPDSNFFSSLLD